MIYFRPSQNARYLSVPTELNQAHEITDSSSLSTFPAATRKEPVIPQKSVPKMSPG
jgi:hypothetical protein